MTTGSTQPKHRSTAQHARRGFTLTETMLVLAIIAVVASIAVPRYDGAVARYRCDLAARRLASDLQMARAQARATSAPIEVVINKNSYTIHNIPALDESGATYHVDLSQAPYAVAIKHSLGNPAKIVFNPYGVPNQGAAVVVSANRHTRTVTLDAHSGVAQVE